MPQAVCNHLRRRHLHHAPATERLRGRACEVSLPPTSLLADLACLTWIFLPAVVENSAPRRGRVEFGGKNLMVSINPKFLLRIL